MIDNQIADGRGPGKLEWEDLCYCVVNSIIESDWIQLRVARCEGLDGNLEGIDIKVEYNVIDCWRRDFINQPNLILVVLFHGELSNRYAFYSGDIVVMGSVGYILLINWVLIWFS